jgi:4-carboxymuconolactone decarboxylase
MGDDMSGDRTEKGISLAGKMMGEGVAAQMKAGLESSRFGAGLSKLALEHVFNGVWARPGLDLRSRSLVTLGILIALRQSEELKVHVMAAIRNGCTVYEIEEVLYHATAYAGFPAAVLATGAAKEVLREEGLIE